MTALDQRTDGEERIAVAGFKDAGEGGVDVGWKRSILVPINELLCRRCGKFRRCWDSRLVLGPAHEGEHAPVDVSGFDLCDDVGLKIRDQLGRVCIALLGAVT